MKNIVFGATLVLLILGVIFAIWTGPVKSTWTGTVYIRADGSIDPQDAPIMTYDNITYTLTDDIVSSYHGIVVERDNIIIHGADHTLKGNRWYTSDSKGVDLTERKNVTIKKMKIMEFDFGILLFSSLNNTVSENSLIENEFGIEIAGYSTGNNISWNILVDNGLTVFSYPNYIVNNVVNGKPLVYLESVSDIIVGNAGQVTLVNCTRIRVENLTLFYVELIDTNSTIVTGNNVTGYGIWTGIFILRSYDNNISHNYITDNGHGIYLVESSNNFIRWNKILRNGWTGICIQNSHNNTILGNTVTTYSIGIEVTWSLHNAILENIITGNYYGVHLIGSFNNEIFENKMVGNKYGVWLESSSNNIITRNNITEGKFNICLYNSANNNLLSENILTASTSYSLIFQFKCVNNTVFKNVIEKNSIGILLVARCKNNIIFGNKITANKQFGIELMGTECSNNIIFENNIMNNGCGMYLSTSSNNIIYHNNFINNTQQIYNKSPEYSNFWDDDYPLGGNYWSDYNGTDLYSGRYQNETGSDGIGDTPYIIDANNTDNYPLMGPFGGSTLKGKSITAFPSSDVCLIFEDIMVEGLTTVNIRDIGPEPPSGFKLAGNYYDIKTTASYSGTITIRIVYDDSNMTAEEENGLRLMQWDETLQQWMDITTFLDAENNVIYGEASHLSIFAIVTSTTTYQSEVRGGESWKKVLVAVSSIE